MADLVTEDVAIEDVQLLFPVCLPTKTLYLSHGFHQQRARANMWNFN